MISTQVSVDFSLTEIVELVSNVQDEPYRPEIPKTSEPVEAGMLDLMAQCWKELPGNRPDFGTVKQKLKDINKDQWVMDVVGTSGISLE